MAKTKTSRLQRSIGKKSRANKSSPRKDFDGLFRGFFFGIASLLSAAARRFLKFMLSFLARGIFCSMLLCCRFDSYRVLYLFIRPLRWGHFCRLIQNNTAFLFNSYLLCYLFNSHRVLYLSIRPLRWGHFCRLKQKYPKVRF